MLLTVTASCTEEAVREAIGDLDAGRGKFTIVEADASSAPYEEIACRLALDEGYRRRIVQRLEAGRMTSPLFDTERGVRNFEKVFSKMWEIHADGREPEEFEIK